MIQKPYIYTFDADLAGDEECGYGIEPASAHAGNKVGSPGT